MTDYHAEQREKKRHRAQHGMRVTGRSTKTVLHPLAHRNDYTPGPNEPTQWATLLGLTLSRRTAARWAKAARDEGRHSIIVPLPRGWFQVWAEKRRP